MVGYVARDKDGTLYLYDEKPEYYKDSEKWFNKSHMICLPKDFSEFDDMLYTDKPIKVEINIKRV